MGICMAASKQTYTHTHVQCNSASVGLAQAYPNQYMGTLLVLKLPKARRVTGDHFNCQT